MGDPEDGPRYVSLYGYGLAMMLSLPGASPVATCECGHRSHGDSINDAVLAWTAHVTGTPACREKL